MPYDEQDIERERRQATSKRQKVDYDAVQLKRDLLVAVRTDTPEEFAARMTNHGISLSSDQGRKVMEAYWAMRRELQR